MRPAQRRPLRPKARAAALNQITHLLFTAPETIRARYGWLKGAERTDALARLGPTVDAVHVAVLTALKSLAQRVEQLTAEHAEPTTTLQPQNQPSPPLPRW